MDSKVITISTYIDEGDTYVLSGVVVLCSCILDDQRTNTGWKWGHRHYDTIRQSKKI